MPGRYNSSSIEGGIFAEVAVTQPPPRRAHASHSSIEGGIFGNDSSSRPVTPRNAITKSSIEGGVFAGQPIEVENMIPRAVKPTAVVKEHTAGMISRPVDDYSEPLKSARSDPNRSSIQGGIFG
uniref:Uncharacterized protein n=1 Tax=Haptolina ericina TaxID=156174 RepID=A0A7S3B354_9EUKA|mmetsp:Transcript_45177/g.102018  ORF Transcript_45177/g.102018 Transcript_45177/m.102018 type:complete len:124 (+) Transcript_45177:53-424(+)